MKIRSLKDRPYDDKDAFYYAYEFEKEILKDVVIKFRYSELDNRIWVSRPKDCKFDFSKVIKEFEDAVNKKLKEDNTQYGQKIHLKEESK